MSAEVDERSKHYIKKVSFLTPSIYIYIYIYVTQLIYLERTRKNQVDKF